MAMFEKEKDQQIPGPGTVVGANVKLSGILKDTNDITVHGKVEGEVISDHNVMISETAEIKGPISAQNVVVAGVVNGSITADQKLEILPTGKVFGAMTMKDLLIRSGAVFVGKSTMPDQKRPEASFTNDKSKEPERETPSAARTKTLTYDVEE